jgi:hypothetical protein
MGKELFIGTTMLNLLVIFLKIKFMAKVLLSLMIMVPTSKWRGEDMKVCGKMRNLQEYQWTSLIFSQIRIIYK